MLVKTITSSYDLAEEFRAMNRDYYSHEGYEALLDLFNEYSEPVELDVIAISCEFDEYEPSYVADQCGFTYNDMDYSEASKEYGEDIVLDELMTYLNYHSWAVSLDNGNILYQSF